MASDSGAFSGSLPIEPFELLTPIAISEDSFDSLKQRLSGGFTEVSREFAMKGVKMSDISRGVRGILNVVEIINSTDSAKFCGCLRRGMAEDYVLVSCSFKGSDPESKTLLLVLNCSDAVLCATLGDFLKRNLVQCMSA